MGNIFTQKDDKIHEQCHIKSCKKDAIQLLDQYFYDGSCAMCFNRAIYDPQCKTCPDHKINYYYICPNTKATYYNYYFKDMSPYNIKGNDNFYGFKGNPYKIRNDYVWFVPTGTHIYRFKHSHSNIYAIQSVTCFQDVYDLTVDALIDELKKIQSYINIIPKDIINIINQYI